MDKNIYIFRKGHPILLNWKLARTGMEVENDRYNIYIYFIFLQKLYPPPPPPPPP